MKASSFWDVLVKRGYALARAYGKSMRPSILSGDILTCKAISVRSARPGDVIAITLNHHVRFHRLVWKSRFRISDFGFRNKFVATIPNPQSPICNLQSEMWYLYLKGDAYTHLEMVPWGNAVVGRVEVLKRRSVNHSARNGLIALLLSFFTGFGYTVLRIRYRILRRWSK